MRTITLTEVIHKEQENEKFAECFEREMLINEIAKLVVSLRYHAKLTQQEFAEKSGTTQPVISRLESGADHRVPSLELLSKLAAAANCKLKLVVENP